MRTIGRPHRGRRRVVGLVAATTMLTSLLGAAASIANSGDGAGAGPGAWLVAADGGIFSLGGAVFRGSAGADRLPAPVVAMMPTGSAAGYWLTGTDGATYAFGDATVKGSAAGRGPIVAAAASPTGEGYWQFTAAGAALAFGDAADIPGAATSAAPLVGAVVVPARPALAPPPSSVPVTPAGPVGPPAPPPPPPGPPAADGVCDGRLPTNTTLDAHRQPGPALLDGTPKNDVI